ncbi:MAG: aldo/keto reductase, partial [Clostridia bacterium]|nr:aldo/keto reductase [Clostridia bacterium]
QMREAMDTGIRIDVNEVPYNIFSRAIEANILPFCASRRIPIFASMALQQGLLTGMYQSASEVPMHQAHSRHYKVERGGGTSRHGEAGAEEEMFAALGELKRIADELGSSIAQMAIAWVMSRTGVTSTLVGNRKPQQLDENIRAASLTLAPETIARIDRASQPVLDVLGDNPDYYENSENARIF